MTARERLLIIAQGATGPEMSVMVNAGELEQVLNLDAAAVPAGWMDPASLDVIHAVRKAAWERDYGLGGKSKAAQYTVPLYTATPASTAPAPVFKESIDG